MFLSPFAARSWAPARLLLVDDNEDDRTLFCAVAASSGLKLEVFEVGSGEQALRYLAGDGMFADREQYPVPDLMVLDIEISVVSGLELLAWLRRSRRWRDLPVVVLTGCTEPSCERTARALGVLEWLEKRLGLNATRSALQRIAKHLVERRSAA